jgi:hypothetical protein
LRGLVLVVELTDMSRFELVDGFQSGGQRRLEQGQEHGWQWGLSREKEKQK